MSETPAEPLRPKDVARVLSEIAALGELNAMDSFRIRAFQNAARLLEGTDADLEALARADRLTTLKGIGPGLASVVGELVLTGRSTPYDELRAATPVGLFDLMRIPGLGTKRIRTLHDELGIDSLDALEEAGRAGRIGKLAGFGPKTEKKILEGIDFARSTRERRRYPDALRSAVRLLEWLVEREEVAAADIVGPLRRRLEVVDRVDLLAATTDAPALVAAFVALNGISSESGGGAAEEGIVEGRLSDGLHVRLRCVAPAEYVVASVRETGSDAHLAQLEERASTSGLRFDESGLWKGDRRVAVKDEAAVYRRLGLQYLPPELREGLGEVELAAEQRVPELVKLEDLTGTFHCHTTYSDGKASVEEMAEAARALGWRYLGLADHSRSAAYAGGLTAERVRLQHAEIDELNGRYASSGSGAFRVFKGIESDILPNGDLDYPPEVLASFDYVVGSVHSGFRSTREEMTERIVRAVRNPALTILGHATGRLLLRREGYPVDVRAVIEAAAESNVVIEINANPNRLDLDWRDVRHAVELGVLIAINPDAHSVPELENVAFGVNMARKAGLSPNQILNCWSLEEIEEYFAERRRQGTT